MLPSTKACGKHALSDNMPKGQWQQQETSIDRSMTTAAN